MIHPNTQMRVGNAALVNVTASQGSGRVALQFDRAVLLQSDTLPVLLLSAAGSLAPMRAGSWKQQSPQVVSAAWDWPLYQGMPIYCYVPEQMCGLRSAAGGRVLSAFFTARTQA